MDIEKAKVWYSNHYKKLFILPIAILLISLFIIVSHYQRTGDIMDKDVSLKGGISVTIYTEKEVDLDNLKDYLLTLFTDVNVRKVAEFGTEKQLGIIVDISELEETKLKSSLSEKLGLELTDDNYSVEVSGASLGASFYNQMLRGILFAFLFMSIVVFIIYRSVITSLAVIQAAVFDIIVPLAFANLIGLKISTAGISAFLLLIGYSVDTDILQTTRMLKRTEGTPLDRMFQSLPTGLTMTFATLAAVSVGYFISASLEIKEMFLILIVGLTMDVIATYFVNSGILYWYTERKKHG